MTMKYQVYGIDAAGKVTHAGTYNTKIMNEVAAVRCQTKWEKWRKQHLAKNPGNYPLREDFDNNRMTMSITAHPVGHPEFTHSYPMY
jgi:hypothetical protein